MVVPERQVVGVQVSLLLQPLLTWLRLSNRIRIMRGLEHLTGSTRQAQHWLRIEGATQK